MVLLPQGAALGYSIAPFQGFFLHWIGSLPQGAALGYFILPFQGEKKSCLDVARASRPWTITGKMPVPQQARRESFSSSSLRSPRSLR